MKNMRTLYVPFWNSICKKKTIVQHKLWPAQLVPVLEDGSGHCICRLLKTVKTSLNLYISSLKLLGCERLTTMSLGSCKVHANLTLHGQNLHATLEWGL